MAAVNGLLFAWLLFPLLFGGTFVNHTDASLFTYPLIALFHERIMSGGVLWNDLSGAGFPSLYVHGYVFQPFLWALLPMMSAHGALHFIMLLYPLLASFMLALALLRMGYRPAAAWLGSIAFPFALWSWLFEPTISFFLPLLAAACLAISFLKSKPVMAAWCCGAITALSFLSLQSHYAVIVLIAMCLLWMTRRLSMTPAQRIPARIDMTFGLAVITGLVIGALRILPLIAYAMLSTRKGAFLDSYVARYAISPGYFFRYLFASSPIPVHESFFANTPFLGVGIISLALLGALTCRKKMFAYICMGIFAGTLFLALPSSLTFKALTLLPGVEQLGDPTRYLILGQLALIALAVEGLHTVSVASAKRIVVTKTYALCMMATSLLLLLVGLILPVMSATSFFSLQNPETTLLILGGLLIGALLYTADSERRRVWYSSGIMASIAAAFLVQGYLGMYASGRPAVHFGAPTIEILSNNEAVIFPYLTQRGLEITPLDALSPAVRYLAVQALGIPNTHLFHRLQNVTMFDHIQTQRLHALLDILEPTTGDVNGQAAATLSIPQLQQQLLEHWSLLKRLGISHVLTPIPLPGQTEIMSSLISPAVYESSDTGALVLVHPPATLYIYEVPQPRQHISAPKEVVLQLPDEEAARNLLLTATTRDRTVIECWDCATTDGAGNVKLSLLDRTPVRTRVRVQTDTQRWIIIHRQLLPGWRAYVDGNMTDVSIADSLFIAIPVPAGDHDVVAAFSVTAMLQDALSLLFSPKHTPWFS